MKKTVLVALSGGVDSAVTLALLKKKGYKCIGCTMLLQDQGQEEDLAFAKRVAEHLETEHIVVDFRDKFKACVVDYFLKEYRDTRTPNPCIECNKHIKSRAFYKLMKEQGSDYFATGHYARVLNDSLGIHLYRAKDKQKDQSYFLYPFEKEILSHLILPLGDLTKEETRRIAKDLSLPSKDRGDSQDICFIKDGDYIGFLENLCPDLKGKEGDIVYKGKVVGRHKGLYRYTIGQRAGLGVALGYPVYVSSLDSKKNRVILGDKEDLISHELKIKNVNILEELPNEFECTAKIRSVSSPFEARAVKNEDKTVSVFFKSGHSSVTKGQSAVLYKDDLLLLGGVIF